MNGTPAGQRGAGAAAPSVSLRLSFASQMLLTQQEDTDPGHTGERGNFRARSFALTSRHGRNTEHGTRFPGLSARFSQPQGIQLLPQHHCRADIS